MANSLLTPTQILRKSLMVLHQKCNFIGSLNRQYDGSYAQSGAKIGDSLKIRLPNQYTVTSGAALTTQEVTESSVTLQVSTQKHVGMHFTSSDLTLTVDDFTERYINPAMSVLAANIEADAFSMMDDVYQAVDNVGSAITLNKALTARKRLVDSLAPGDARTLILNTQDNLDLVDGLKGLFQDSTQIAKQYREGKVGTTAGFGDVFENTIMPTHTTGDDDSTCTVNGASQTGASVTITNGSSKTFEVGDVVTFAGCNRVHPETKADTGVLQQFVVTAAEAAGGTSLAISPSIVVSGAKQNVSASPTNSGAVTKIGGASAIYKPSLAFHRDAFAFATADLVMPKGVDFAARETMDGISMRLIRDYDINSDRLVTRLDVLYGYLTVRPELACRILSN
jgi:hypothetical protein